MQAWTNAFPIVVAFLIAFAGYRYVRAHGGAEALRELEKVNDVLERRLRELTAENRQLAQVVGALEQRTNLEPIAASVVEQFALHERRAQERHERELILFDLLGRRLGPDPERA